MKFFVRSLVLIALFFSQPISQAKAANESVNAFNKSADNFLKQYVVGGKIDYKNLKKRFSEIDQLYKSLAQVDLDNMSDADIKAFYINAYNIIVIRQITDYYPLKSALDKNGFFDKVKHNVGGESLTLDQIEKGKVIIPFKDPRVHFAFSCAAQGCPELANFAFMGATIDQQLEKRTKNAINNPDFIMVKADKKEVKLSMIFKWYEKDFTLEAPSVMAYINKYRTQKIPASYDTSFYPYDWSLNNL